MAQEVDIAEQFEKHLNSPKQTWLLGAGVSFPANIPLMYALTSRVMLLAKDELFSEDDAAKSVLDFIVRDCGDQSHIEHHLTHLGDLISIAERSRTGGIEIGGARVPKEKLIEVHRGLIDKIAETVRWGYKPAKQNAEGAVTEPEEVGMQGASIINIEGHKKFIEAVFGASRAGLDFVRTPVEFCERCLPRTLTDA